MNKVRELKKTLKRIKFFYYVDKIVYVEVEKTNSVNIPTDIDKYKDLLVDKPIKEKKYINIGQQIDVTKLLPTILLEELYKVTFADKETDDIYIDKPTALLAHSLLIGKNKDIKEILNLIKTDKLLSFSIKIEYQNLFKFVQIKIKQNEEEAVPESDITSDNGDSDVISSPNDVELLSKTKDNKD